MPINLQNKPGSQPLLTATPSPPLPQRITIAVSDWVRSAIVVVIWIVILAAVAVAGYAVLRALLFLLVLVQRSLSF